MNAAITTRKELKYLPKSVKRALIQTRGNAKPPKGWKEEPGAMHIGKGIYIIPYSRIEES